jgi:hypothetical protein
VEATSGSRALVGLVFVAGLIAPAQAADRDRVYRVMTPWHHHAEVILRGERTRLLAPGARWRREDASVIVRVVDGPGTLTLWARPGLGISTIPGRVEYVTMRAKYRAPGDTEDADRSSPGSSLPPVRDHQIRHVAYALLVGGETANETCLPLDIAVRGDGTATVSIRNPALPLVRC